MIPDRKEDKAQVVKFSVADNMDDRLIHRLSAYKVEEIYGKLASDIIGGGRLTFLLPKINRNRFEQHVKLAHRKNIPYNYLLNSACLNNIEITRRGQKKIRKLIDWVCSLGILRVTVSNTYLLKLIKRCYPDLYVKISVFAGVDSVPKAKMWEDSGADCITLDSLAVNRDFEILEAIQKSVKADLQLLVNNSCNAYCSMSPTHMNFLAHGSQSGHHTSGFAPDYCYLYCSKMKLENPVNYLKSDWIRPEDLDRYVNLGYSKFKLTERNTPSNIMELRIKAYTQRSYDGNLLDLVQPFSYPYLSGNEKEKTVSPLRLLYYSLRPLKVNPLKLVPFAKLALRRNMISIRKGVSPVFIDNKKLTRFFDRFEEQGCRDIDCEQCSYCHKWAEDCVEIDKDYRKECLALYQQAIDNFEEGFMWRYF